MNSNVQFSIDEVSRCPRNQLVYLIDFLKIIALSCVKKISLLIEIEKNLALSLKTYLYDGIDLSIGIDLENTRINAFSHKDSNGKYYIAISMGLIVAFFCIHSNFSLSTKAYL